MTDKDKKALQDDPDGLLTYEYIANHIESVGDDMDFLAENMIAVDRNGQFLVSAARYLAAIDPAAFSEPIARIVAVAIDRDRERRYIGDLLPALYGTDYADRADELARTDDNFRRIYKRIHTEGKI